MARPHPDLARTDRASSGPSFGAPRRGRPLLGALLPGQGSALRGHADRRQGDPAGRFGEFNRPGIRSTKRSGPSPPASDTVRGLFVGQSTGTSGNRGRFVISPAERFAWLGTIVAKAVPDALFRRRRVALALPGFSSLYRSASQRQPDPARLLRPGARSPGMAGGLSPPSRPTCWWRRPRCFAGSPRTGALGGVEPFSGAEVLDPLDREIIELGERKAGARNLHGDGGAVRRRMPARARFISPRTWSGSNGSRSPGSGSVVPIVTDMVRRVQPMIRYRMNDLLELSDRRAPAARPSRRSPGSTGAWTTCSSSTRARRPGDGDAGRAAQRGRRCRLPRSATIRIVQKRGRRGGGRAGRRPSRGGRMPPARERAASAPRPARRAVRRSRRSAGFPRASTASFAGSSGERG